MYHIKIDGVPDCSGLDLQPYAFPTEDEAFKFGLGVILHTKAMVVDESTSILGSTNLDYRSIEYNCELSAIIRNDAFGRQMCQLFENDIGFSEQIKLNHWRGRPHWDRFVHWAVSRARYLL